MRIVVFVSSFAKYVNGRIVPESAGLTSFIIVFACLILLNYKEMMIVFLF